MIYHKEFAGLIINFDLPRAHAGVKFIVDPGDKATASQWMAALTQVAKMEAMRKSSVDDEAATASRPDVAANVLGCATAYPAWIDTVRDINRARCSAVDHMLITCCGPGLTMLTKMQCFSKRLPSLQNRLQRQLLVTLSDQPLLRSASTQTGPHRPHFVSSCVCCTDPALRRH